MSTIAKGSGGGTDWEPIPTGSYVARCTTVCDLGLQPTGYGTKEKIYIGFEVPSVRVTWSKDDEDHEGPALIGSRYTLSVHRKSILGQHLVSWRGKEFTEEELEGFELMDVLGAPCMISVVHNHKGEKTYANISAIMRVPKGTTVPDLEGELVGYSATHPKFNGTMSKLPEWLQKLAREGQIQRPTETEPPTQTLAEPEALNDDFDDDIPFR